MSFAVEPDRITDYTKVSDHADAGVKLLPSQFVTKPLIVALFRPYFDQAQQIEDAAWAVLVDTTLDNAAGDALDQIGALLGFPRGALGDDAYRAALRAIVRARTGSGTAEDIIAAVRLMLGATTFTHLEGYASVLVEPHSPVPTIVDAMITVLRLAKVGGVQIQLIDPSAAESALFTFSTRQFFADTDAARGFSDTTQVAGGLLTGVLA